MSYINWRVLGRKVAEILPRLPTSASNPCASVSWQRWARCSRSGWPAVSPPGGLQSAGHRRCANGVPNSFPTGSVQSQLANLDILSHNSFEQFDLNVFSPILPFPSGLGITGAQLKKNRFLCLVGPSWSIFSPSEPRLKNDIEKTSKKVRKSRILASQTPPKTLPKSFQNRGSKKHAIFHRFLLDVFLFFNLRFLENRGFTIGKSLILKFSLKSCYRKFNVFLFQKTYQKPFENEVRTLPKSMPKTCCFSTSFFSGFGLDLGRLGLPTWSQVGHVGS